MDIRRYDVKRTRRSLSLNLDYNIDDNNQLFLKTIYNHRDDWENRFRLRVGSIDMEDMTARIRRQTKGGISDGNNKGTRLEDQKTQKYSLSIICCELKLDWKVGYSEASEDRPDECTRYDKDVPFSSLNISNPKDRILLGLVMHGIIKVITDTENRGHLKPMRQTLLFLLIWKKHIATMMFGK